MTAVIKMENVSKSFQKNIVLDNLNLEVEQGELVAIIGKSGCGKSTLLNILGLLDKASLKYLINSQFVLFQEKLKSYCMIKLVIYFKIMH